MILYFPLGLGIGYFPLKGAKTSLDCQCFIMSLVRLLVSVRHKNWHSRPGGTLIVQLRGIFPEDAWNLLALDISKINLHNVIKYVYLNLGVRYI